MSKQPNILILLSDQHRWSALNCYGNGDVVSPNFDALAGQGVRYPRCISGAPMCCPYRATFQTGLHPHQHGVRINKAPWLGQHFRGLADYFNDAGYETCFIGKSHWGRQLHYDMPRTNGYVAPHHRMRWKHWHGTQGHNHYDSQTYHDDGSVARDFEDQYQPTAQTDLALEQIAAFGDSPWLMQLNWGPPHVAGGKIRKQGVPLIETCHRVNREYGFGLDDALIDDYPNTKLASVLPQHLVFDSSLMPDRYLEMYDVEKLNVDPNIPEQFHKLVRYHLKEYYGMVTSLDDELGRIMKFLEATGRDRDTMVIYTSDHGDKIAAHCAPQKFRTKSTWHQNSSRVPLIVWGPHVGVGRGGTNNTPVNSVDFLPTLLDYIGVPVDPHLPGESVADTFRGDGVERDRQVLLSLDTWRGIYDGRHLYAIQGLDESWQPLTLVDTVTDPYDMQNLLDDSAHSATKARLHEALVRELIRTSDDQFILRTGLKAANTGAEAS